MKKKLIFSEYCKCILMSQNASENESSKQNVGRIFNGQHFYISWSHQLRLSMITVEHTFDVPRVKTT